MLIIHRGYLGRRGALGEISEKGVGLGYLCTKGHGSSPGPGGGSYAHTYGEPPGVCCAGGGASGAGNPASAPWTRRGHQYSSARSRSLSRSYRAVLPTSLGRVRPSPEVVRLGDLLRFSVRSLYRLPFWGAIPGDIHTVKYRRTLRDIILPTQHLPIKKSFIVVYMSQLESHKDTRMLKESLTALFSSWGLSCPKNNRVAYDFYYRKLSLNTLPSPLQTLF